MWNYEKRLQYPINIKNCNPTLAAMIISQYGGLYFIKVYNIKIKMKVVIAMRNFKVNGTKVSIVNSEMCIRDRPIMRGQDYVLA